MTDTSIEIYHGAHGQYETRSPVRTFALYDIDGAPHLLAAYTCTPLVKIPVAKLEPGEKVMGDTVAELGNRNRPLDMVVYEKDGQDHVLMANNARGLMKISLKDDRRLRADHRAGPDKAGLEYETIEELAGVVQLDRLNDDNAVVLVDKSTAGKTSARWLCRKPPCRPRLPLVPLGRLSQPDVALIARDHVAQSGHCRGGDPACVE